MLRLTRERRDPYEVRSLRTRMFCTNPGLAKKVDSNHRVLSVKVHPGHVAPARERSDPHQVLRLRTTFSARPPGGGEATR